MPPFHEVAIRVLNGTEIESKPLSLHDAISLYPAVGQTWMAYVLRHCHIPETAIPQVVMAIIQAVKNMANLILDANTEYIFDQELARTLVAFDGVQALEEAIRTEPGERERQDLQNWLKDTVLVLVQKESGQQ